MRRKEQHGKKHREKKKAKTKQYQNSVWWEDREKEARKGQIQEEGRTISRWIPPGQKCVQIILAQRRCEWRPWDSDKRGRVKRKAEHSKSRARCPREGAHAASRSSAKPSHFRLVRALLPATEDFVHFALHSKNWSTRRQAPSQQALNQTAVSYCNPRLQCRLGSEYTDTWRPWGERWSAWPVSFP